MVQRNTNIEQPQRADLIEILRVNWDYPDYSDPTWATRDTDDITFHLQRNGAFSPFQYQCELVRRPSLSHDKILSNESRVLATPSLVDLIESQEEGYLYVGKYTLRGKDDSRCPIKYIRTRERVHKPYGQSIPSEGYYDTNPNYEI